MDKEENEKCLEILVSEEKDLENEERSQCEDCE